jgi:hypothetical protein
MSEILFIAADPAILSLIENLQPLLLPEVTLESDYTNGIKVGGVFGHESGYPAR